MLRKIFALGLASSISTSLLLDESTAPDTKRHAICILYPNKSTVRGLASFTQDNISSPTKITFSVRGLTPNRKHGIHIHQFGDLTHGSDSVGLHYNPHIKRHGGPYDDERHIGDMGNLVADTAGTAFMSYSDNLISLFGEYSIVGRSVVVQGQEDDLGKTRNPELALTLDLGKTLASGVIGLSKQFIQFSPTGTQ